MENRLRDTKCSNLGFGTHYLDATHINFPLGKPMREQKAFRMTDDP